MIGGNYSCYDCHVESYYGGGTAVDANASYAQFYGGIFIPASATGTDASLIQMAAGRNTVILDGVMIDQQHTVTSVVNQTAGGSNNPTVSLRRISLIDPGNFTHALTTLTGPGIDWCLPFDPASGSGPGFCYDGNIYRNPITSSSNSPTKTDLPGSAASMIWNASGTDGDMGLVNTFKGASNTNISHSFWINNSTRHLLVANFSRDGGMFLLDSSPKRIWIL